MRRERSLLIPVALAIFGPAQILMGLAMAGAATVRNTADAATGGQMLLLLPAAALVLFGNIVTAVIVLTPGISVGEALARAGKSIARAITTVLLLGALFLLAVVAIAIVATLGTISIGADPRSPALASRVVVLMAVPMIVMLVRMLLLAPVLAMEDNGPATAVRRVWALSRHNVLRFAAVWVLTMFLGILVTVIEQFVVGSVFGLLKLAVGEAELLAVVQMIIGAGIEAVLSLGIAVYLALIYRRLTAV
ncbi:MAG: hypothetical protein ABW128_01000 [Rhizorhabdus sp.]